MKEFICKIINEWDPIKIKKITPADEYLSEISQLECAIHQNSRISEKELVLIIKEIFIESFGELFISSDEDIERVALKILELIKSKKEKV